jgi:hypothetical protein
MRLVGAVVWMADRRMEGQATARRVCQNGHSCLTEVKSVTAKPQASFKKFNGQFLERFRLFRALLCDLNIEPERV